MKKEVQNLISQGKTKQAIQQIINSGNEDIYNSAIMLMGRWNRLQSNITLGTLSNQETTLETNKINFAVLSLLGIDPSENQSQSNKMTTDSTEDKLKKVAADYKRRNEKVSKDALDFITQLRQYNDDKILNPSYDVTGRRLRFLNQEINQFFEKLSEIKEDSIEEFVSQVNELLSASVPNYDSLGKAYNLCVGRGFSNEKVHTMLKVQSNDNEPRIYIAEQLELFLSTF